ncbi:MAG: YetF domain-containing protein, partial [Acidobacteriota bacterium]
MTAPGAGYNRWPTDEGVDVERIFFSGWSSVLRTLVIGVLAYGGVVGLLRLSGKRTLAKMNAFDLIVTVALGSTLATVLLSKDVALADGLVALGLLVALQFVMTWTSVRVGWVRRAVTGEPRMLLHKGAPLPAAMRAARVTSEELLAAVRAAGVAALDEVEAVVLETTDRSASSAAPSGRGRPAS